MSLLFFIILILVAIYIYSLYDFMLGFPSLEDRWNGGMLIGVINYIGGDFMLVNSRNHLNRLLTNR